MTDATRQILVAIDTPDIERAAALTSGLAGAVGGVKLGLEFFSANGGAGVGRIQALGPLLFLDLKFHDIPNMVAGAVAAATRLAPKMLDVHVAGGPAMMRTAADAAGETAEACGIVRPLVLGVTVLTSMDDQDLSRVGQVGPVQDQVRRLARLCQDCGLDGVVCPPREIAVLRQDCGPNFKLVVPGIRPTWAAAGDQKRVTTPAEAVAGGADYLVIGRPITGADDPLAAARRIGHEIEALEQPRSGAA